MPIPYHPRRPKPLAVPTEEEVAEAVAPSFEVFASGVRDEPVTAVHFISRPPIDETAEPEASKHDEE